MEMDGVGSRINFGGGEVPVDIHRVKNPVVLLYNVNPEWTQEEKDEVIRLSAQFGDALTEIGHPTSLVPIADDNIAGHLLPFDPAKYIIFNWCEEIPGIKRSEWLVAKKLEMLGYTFTGAGSEALSLAQDKYRVKVILDEALIPTPTWQVFDSSDVRNWKIFPAIVKPRNEHCSAGITPESVIMNQTDLKNRISFILNKYSQPALVEDFIDGREFHVSVLGNETLMVLPVAEMDFSYFGNIKDRLCTYDSKFIPGAEHYEKIETLLPAPLTNDEKKSWKRSVATLTGRLDAEITPAWISGCGITPFTFWMLIPTRISAAMPVWRAPLKRPVSVTDRWEASSSAWPLRGIRYLVRCAKPPVREKRNNSKQTLFLFTLSGLSMF